MLNELLRILSFISLEVNKWFGDRRAKGVFLLDFSYSVIYEHHERMRTGRIQNMDPVHGPPLRTG